MYDEKDNKYKIYNEHIKLPNTTLINGQYILSKDGYIPFQDINMKRENKYIYDPIIQTTQTGGSNIQPQYDTIDTIFDDTMIPINKYNKIAVQINDTLNKIKDLIPIISVLQQNLYYINPLTNNPRNNESIYIENEKNITYKKDKKHNLYEICNTSDIWKQTIIITYKFLHSVSIMFHNIIYTHKLIKNKNNILLITKNSNFLSTLCYFMTKQTLDIFCLLYIHGIDKQIINNTIEMLNANKIKYNLVNEPLQNSVIEPLINHNIKYDFVAIDLIILNKYDTFINVRNNYAFNTWLSATIIGLSQLKIGGGMFLYIPFITNAVVFEYIIHISQYFKYYKYIHSYKIDGTLNFMCVIFKNYTHEIDVNELKKINDTLYRNDPTGGINYEPSNVNDIKILKNMGYDTTKYTYKPQTRLVKLLIDNDKITTLKKQYKKKIVKIIKSIKIILFEYEYIYKNYTNETFMKPLLQQNLNYSIYYAKKFDLQLYDWYNINHDEYFNNIINELSNIDIKMLYPISYNECIIGTFKKINISKTSKQNYTYLSEISEIMFHSLGGINHDNIKEIELFINNKLKDLNRYIKKHYSVEINNRYVSRAWLKVHEIIQITQIFDLTKKQITGFHVCEAPGNFIKSIEYYLHIHNIKYKWNAQTLCKTKSDIYDEYKFIEQTFSQWDFGPEKCGDITNIDNMEYYINKYEGKDIFVGDCGEQWTSDVHKNLATYQLAYALIIPKHGGTFIVKTFSVNFDLQYLSFVCMASYIYEKVYIYKSNINFWSPEIYIIGKNKKNTNDYKHIILNIMKEYNKGNILYPINNIPSLFSLEYEFITQQYINMFAKIKKYIGFLAVNMDFFYKKKIILERIINKHNTKWLDKYFVYFLK